MTEFNDDPNNKPDESPIDVPFTEKQNEPNEQPSPIIKNKKEKKNHPVLTIALAAVVGLGAGLGGSWFTMTHMGGSSSGTANLTYSDTTGGSKTTSVATSTSGTGLTEAEVAAKAAPSVVEIVTEVKSSSYSFFGQSTTSEAAGSGVIISSDGYIITNNHVIEDATSIKVTTYDGTEYTATLVGTDSKTDIAVIKIDASNLTAATIGDSSKIAVGDTAVVIGNPLGTLGGTVTDGIISATSRELVLNNESMELIQTNATINSGNSGGGMFDGNGNLIGIVNAKDSGTTSSGTVIEGIGFAIPINKAIDVAQQLIKDGKVTDRATLGVYLQEITQNTQQYSSGLYITSVISGSGAEQAGLKAYDKIVSADGKDISSYSDLTAVLNKKSIGDTIELKIERNSKEMDVTVTLSGALESSTGAVESTTDLG
jgi:serine protease Do